MNKRAQQSVTSLPRSPSDDRRSRMLKYSIAMGIRMICILALLFVQGWWLLVAGIGAVVLPYIAVVIANVTSRPPERTVLVPPEAVRALLPPDATARQPGDFWAGGDLR